MRHAYSSSPGLSEIPGINLHTIWKVEADALYDTSVEYSRATSAQIRAMGGTGLIALRTVSGAGRVYLTSGRVIDAAKSTLILLDWGHFKRYHCRGNEWRFWWFEFTTTGPFQAPLHLALLVPPDPADDGDMAEAYTLLRNEPAEGRRLATATFSKLLFRWLAGWHGHWTVTNRQKVIWRVIELMHERLEHRWTVEEMAHEAGMSRRTFLAAFEEVTGDSPKRFYDRLRITMGEELLRLGLYSVKEVADRFGFSSPYHFSKAFLRHTGYRPSTVLPGSRE
jgi:AraC-like DNA-binding protein